MSWIVESEASAVGTDQLNQFSHGNLMPDFLVWARCMMITETLLDLDQHDGSAIGRRRQENIAMYRCRCVSCCEGSTRLKPQLPMVVVA
jgi:hypothetical protein